MPTAEEDEATRASRALLTHATTTPDDLYSLLSLPTDPAPTASSLKKAWRAAALKYHPDKNAGNEAASAALLDAARKAFDVLSDDVARAAYDDRVRAKREKVEREGRFEEKRRRMKEELERKEGGSGMGKRKGGAGAGAGVVVETEEEKREREVRRLAVDGARRRGEREEQLRREREEEIEARLARSGKRRKTASTGIDAGTPTTPTFSFKKKDTATDSPGPSTPSRFEATMARLRAKQEEKQQLEAAMSTGDASTTTTTTTAAASTTE